MTRRIRELRAERRTSLDELAERAGLRRAMPSLIERAPSSPTAMSGATESEIVGA
ncbi:MAG: hypothetical protein ACYCT1_07500 [Steroidobacteraceae bacterium]